METSTDQPTALSPLQELRAQRLEGIAREQARSLAEPVAEGFTRLTFAKLVEQYRALNDLASHRLPDGPAEKLVRLLVQQHYLEGYELYEELRKLVIQNHPVPDGWEDDRTIPIVIAERRQTLVNALERDTFDIKTVPESRLLGPEHMPVNNIKGELGHQNRLGVASIKIRLGSLYVEDDDTEE